MRHVIAFTNIVLTDTLQQRFYIFSIFFSFKNCLLFSYREPIIFDLLNFLLFFLYKMTFIYIKKFILIVKKIDIGTLTVITSIIEVYIIGST